MPLRIPSAGTPLHSHNLLKALSGLWQTHSSAFQTMLSNRLDKPYLTLVNSGTTACYLALKALASRSSRREVVIPAYTAPSITLPIKKAGLLPRLCEVSLDTLNMDPVHLEKAIGPDTLCVMPVHMFGLPCDMDAIRQTLSDKRIPILEDAASSYGSRLGDRETGTMGDIGFISFNRGKNLSTLAGGCILMDDASTYEYVESEKLKLPVLTAIDQLKLWLKLIGLSVAVRPLGYTLLYEFVRRYKYTDLHTDFVSFQYPEVLAGTGVSLINQEADIIRRRHENGRLLHEGLENIKGIQVAQPIDDAYTAYNQFPLILEDPSGRDVLVDDIFRKTGVEATTLYPDPLHHIYDLGYPTEEDPFPNATYVSRRLLLIPTHPLMNPATLIQVADLIRTSTK
jgi:perosamine synthetase